jgi:dephospho-CoA kinase
MEPLAMTRPTPRTLRPVIGLLGGIGSGKSLVAAQLAKLGCTVVDADRIGHEVLSEPRIRKAILRKFGPDVADARGNLDRRKLGRRVFGNPADLAALERLVHPELWRRVRKAVAAAQRTRTPAVVLDAALILEKGLDNLCSVMLYIDAPAAERRSRIMLTRGWSPSEVRRREACQVSLKTKRNRADDVVDNHTSPEHTLEQIRTILSRVTN